MFSGYQHQKYYLRKKKQITSLFDFKSEAELRDSDIATKLNGYVTGKYSFRLFEEQLVKWNLDEKTKKSLSTELEKVMR